MMSRIRNHDINWKSLRRSFLKNLKEKNIKFKNYIQQNLRYLDLDKFNCLKINADEIRALEKEHTLFWYTKERETNDAHRLFFEKICITRKNIRSFDSNERLILSILKKRDLKHIELFRKRCSYKTDAWRKKSILINKLYNEEKKYIESLYRYYKQQSRKFKAEGLKKIRQRSIDFNYFKIHKLFKNGDTIQPL